jgi:serine/threonine protein kinase
LLDFDQKRHSSRISLRVTSFSGAHMERAARTVSHQPSVVFRDGLGERRQIADPGGSDAVEQLWVSRELAAVPSFEFALRERVSRLAAFRHAYYARVRGVERATDQTLTITSDATAGTRLSDLLARTEERRIPLDINAALCLIRQLVPAVAMLHENARDVAHGALGPERLIITPTARLAIVEHVMGAALEQLRYSQERYWTELRIALPRSPGLPRFDHRTDVTQIGVVALSLILGRALRDDEYPARVGDVVAATWAVSPRGGFEPLPTGLRGWLTRALQLDPKQAFASAIEARAELDKVIGDSDYIASPANLEAFLARCASTERPATRVSSIVPPPVTPVAPPIVSAASSPEWEREDVSDLIKPIAPQPPLASREPLTPPTRSTPPPPAASPFITPPAAVPPALPPTRPVVVTPVRVPAPAAPPPTAPPPAPSPRIAPIGAASSSGVPSASPSSPSASVAASAPPSSPSAYGMPAEPVAAPSVYGSPESASAPTVAPVAASIEGRFESPLQRGSLFELQRESDAAVEPARGDKRRRRLWMALGAVVVIAAGGGIIMSRSMLPAPAVSAASGTLVVTTNPPGAQALIDGRSQGVTPITVTLPAGAHNLELRGGGEPRTIPITIAPGKELAQYVELPKATAALGQLQVKSEPSGARVSVDGTPRGTAPVLVTSLAPGEHNVVLESDLGTVRQSVTVESGLTATLVVPLSGTQGSAASGWVAVTSPVVVQLYENGQLLGSSQSDRVMVTAGRHELTLVNDALGYRDTRTVQVPAGKTASLSVEIPKGTIALNAQPWAEVWIDGEKVGETPIGNYQLPVGTHDVVFRHPELGEQHYTTTVTLKTPARLSVDLRKK